MMRATRPCAKLGVERLEDRSLPSTLALGDELLEELLRKTGQSGSPNTLVQASPFDRDATRDSQQVQIAQGGTTTKVFSQAGHYDFAVSDSMSPTLPVGVGISQKVEVSNSANLSSGTSETFSDPNFILQVERSIIPVNANNHNGSDWVDIGGTEQTGIPSIRDFDAKNLPVNDTELMLCKITSKALLSSVTAKVDYFGEGKTTLWMDQKKQTLLPSSYTLSKASEVFAFYIEGTHESRNYSDVLLTVSGTTTTGGSYTDAATLTVGPTIARFELTPNHSTTFFANSTDLLNGLFTHLPSQPGIYMFGDVNTADSQGRMSGSVAFVQTLLDVKNGVSNTGAGWTFDPDLPVNSYNLGTGPFSFPLNDYHLTGPTYDAGVVRATTTNGERISAEDSPLTGYPAYTTSTHTCDVKFEFKTYLVWQYSDGSIYSLANVTWDAYFYAYKTTTSAYTIDPSSRIIVHSNYLYDNTDPWTDSVRNANVALRWMENV